MSNCTTVNENFHVYLFFIRIFIIIFWAKSKFLLFSSKPFSPTSEPSSVFTQVLCNSITLQRRRRRLHSVTVAGFLLPLTLFMFSHLSSETPSVISIIIEKAEAEATEAPSFILPPIPQGNHKLV